MYIHILRVLTVHFLNSSTVDIDFTLEVPLVPLYFLVGRSFCTFLDGFFFYPYNASGRKVGINRPPCCAFRATAALASRVTKEEA